MGITEEASVAQKVVIWEGMHAAQQSGDSIGVSAPYRAPPVGYSGIFADWKGNRPQHYEGVLLDSSTRV